MMETIPVARPGDATAVVGLGRRTVRAVGDRAMQTAGELTELVAGVADNTLAFNPLIGLRGRDLAGAAAALLEAAARSGRKGLASVMEYAAELWKVADGTSEAMPDARDRRFADPAWRSNFLCKRLMQVHTVTQRSLARFIDESSLDPPRKRRAHFLASLVTDALAPSNWPLANPAALRAIVDTGGENLVAGAKNLVRDVRHNHMLPSQVDSTPFELGVNVAATPGQVVYRTEMFELVQYAPSTPSVHARPLVMSPPQVNKFYAVDLAPEKSLVKWAVDSGVQLFIVAWRNPTALQSHWGLEHYVMALDQAVDAARAIAGSADVNMWGSCSGGMTLAAYLGWLAARGERKVAHTTWAVCILDTEAALGDSTLGLFTTPNAIRAAKARSRRRGIVSGHEMARMFAWLRANDLVWNYWVNNYLLGKKPPAFDILFWNNDTTRLPARFHCDLLDLFEANPFARAGALAIGGLPIDLGRVEVGAYVVGGINDHITPWRGCYGTARLLGPRSTFVLANAGHLQSLINPPGAAKAHFIAAPADAEDADAWARSAGARRTEGSWWPHWRSWIQERSGELIDAPTTAGSRDYPPLGAAPGTYVHES
jgi:polyhydroxyalkanoate synthase subunit PhaC